MNPVGASEGTLRVPVAYSSPNTPSAAINSSMPGPPANRTAARTCGANWRTYDIDSCTMPRCP